MIIFIIVVGNKDYDVGPYTVMFPATVTESSFAVNIFGDNILENDEMIQLNIMISSLPKRVIVGSSSQSTIIIIDNDCKLLHHYMRPCMYTYLLICYCSNQSKI